MCNYLLTRRFMHREIFSILILRKIAGSLATEPVSAIRTVWYCLQSLPQRTLAYEQFKLIKSSRAVIKSHSSWH